MDENIVQFTWRDRFVRDLSPKSRQNTQRRLQKRTPKPLLPPPPPPPSLPLDFPYKSPDPSSCIHSFARVVSAIALRSSDVDLPISLSRRLLLEARGKSSRPLLHRRSVPVLVLASWRPAFESSESDGFAWELRVSLRPSSHLMWCAGVSSGELRMWNLDVLRLNLALELTCWIWSLAVESGSMIVVKVIVWMMALAFQRWHSAFEAGAGPMQFLIWSSLATFGWFCSS